MPAELGEEREGADRQLPQARLKQALSGQRHPQPATNREAAGENKKTQQSYKYKVVVEGKLWTEKATASLCCNQERFMLSPPRLVKQKGFAGLAACREQEGFRAGRLQLQCMAKALLIN